MATNQEKLDAIDYRTGRYLDLKTSDVPGRIVNAPIKRGGAEITLIQEIADGKTLGLENKAALVEAHRKLDAILAKLNEGA